jgi:hypothetical protein
VGVSLPEAYAAFTASRVRSSVVTILRGATRSSPVTRRAMLRAGGQFALQRSRNTLQFHVIIFLPDFNMKLYEAQAQQSLPPPGGGALTRAQCRVHQPAQPRPPGSRRARSKGNIRKRRLSPPSHARIVYARACARTVCSLTTSLPLAGPLPAGAAGSLGPPSPQSRCAQIAFLAGILSTHKHWLGRWRRCGWPCADCTCVDSR